MSNPDSGRKYEPVVTAKLLALADSRSELQSPRVGLWRGAPAEGSLVTPGCELGELEILGVLYQVKAPPKARGIVVEVGGDHGLARRPVGYGTVMVTIDSSASLGAVAAAEDSSEGAAQSGALTFCAPTSGRFYDRPAPDKRAFVEVGDEISVGQTLCLLEVMKTFNRVNYGGGDQLPERARVLAIRPASGDDLEVGDVILELEAL